MNISTNSSFGMTRLMKAKKAVDISPNTIRRYAREGLTLYRVKKAVYFSNSELEQFIRMKAAGIPTAAPKAE